MYSNMNLKKKKKCNECKDDPLISTGHIKASGGSSYLSQTSLNVSVFDLCLWVWLVQAVTDYPGLLSIYILMWRIHYTKAPTKYRMSLSTENQYDFCGEVCKLAGGLERHASSHKNRTNYDKMYVSHVC